MSTENDTKPTVMIWDRFVDPGERPEDPGPCPSAGDARVRDAWIKKRVAFEHWTERKRKFALAQGLKLLCDGESTPEQRAAVQTDIVGILALIALDHESRAGLFGLLF